MAKPRVLMIVPTLGTRIEFLRQSLESISSQDTPADLVVVCPQDALEARDLAHEHNAVVLDDPGSLPKAINAGATQIQPHHEFINWLGDDDLLERGSLDTTTRTLDQDPQATVAFGACRYVDEHNKELWISKAGKWAPRILSWGPDLIPQPGMLIRVDAWQAVNGVDESLSMAFDLDLLLKLKQRGPLLDCNAVVASFRWHTTSLTASDRSKNLEESELVKRRYLTRTQSRMKWLWEKPVRIATRVAAHEVQRRAKAAAT
jgi:GT2 family glycosyltransferase